jgi:hypothetical protein
VLGAVGLVVFALLVWRLTAPRSLGDDAGTILHAVTAGDGRALFAYLKKDEVRGLHLTPEKVSQTLNEIVRPRLSLLHRVGGEQTEMAGEGAQALCIQRYESDQGNSFELIGSPFRSENGGQTELWPFIFNAWEIEFLILPGKPKDSRSYAKAIIAGIDKDKAKLIEIGIPGRVISAPDVQFQTWDEVRQIMVSRTGEAGS